MGRYDKLRDAITSRRAGEVGKIYGGDTEKEEKDEKIEDGK